MRSQKPSTLPITLTPAQREQIRQATGKEAPTLKLQLAELEQRLAPGVGMN